jgi:PPOX class probable F420-dependent enzyme
MELQSAVEFVKGRNQGVLVTIRANGRPQLSNIYYQPSPKGGFRISVTDDRAKTANLRRDPRASLYVLGDSFFQYLVLEGTVELSPVATTADDATVEELVDYYRSAQGEHPDWDDYRQAMIAEGRLIARFTPERAYGMVPEG